MITPPITHHPALIAHRPSLVTRHSSLNHLVTRPPIHTHPPITHHSSPHHHINSSLITHLPITTATHVPRPEQIVNAIVAIDPNTPGTAHSVRRPCLLPRLLFTRAFSLCLTLSLALSFSRSLALSLALFLSLCLCMYVSLCLSLCPSLCL
jgi:hypothetical protein